MLKTTHLVTINLLTSMPERVQLKAGSQQVLASKPELSLGRRYNLYTRQDLPKFALFGSLVIRQSISKKIRRWHQIVHASLQTFGILSVAYRRALIRSKSSQWSGFLIHHSDRGIQYCSTYYQHIMHEKLRTKFAITQTKTDGYDPAIQNRCS